MVDIAINKTDYQSFYDERRLQTYAQDYDAIRAEDHAGYRELGEFIQQYDLSAKKCLEIGSSGGFFQDMVEDYTGTDIAESLARHYHKPYKIADGSRYPFPDNTFDAIWTFHVFEHIPDLQTAMLEVVRLLKPGGVVFFAPAWQCRTWAADGYEVRPYSDFGWRGKLVKASIPLRNSIWWRSLFIFPKRIVRQAAYALGQRVEAIKYKKIKANYEIFWQSDSDACNAIDAHDAILWFKSHGCVCLSHPTATSALLFRHGGLVLRKLGDK